MSRIEASGGMLQAVSDGSIQREISRQAYEEAKSIQSGEKVIVGVNRFASGEKEFDVDIHLANQDVKKRQVERLKAVKEKRNSYTRK